VDSRLDLPLCREASNCSSLHPSGRFSSPSGRLSVFNQALGFLSKYRYGKIATTVRTRIPVRTRSSLRQVRNSNPTVWMPVYHSPNARTTDMEIACSRSTFQTAIHLVRTKEAFIRKFLVADVRPSRRQGNTVRTWLSNRKKNLVKFLKFQSHSCPSERPMTNVRTAPSFIKPDDHLNPQPINKGPWA
jgi:hypothetical protein